MNIPSHRRFFYIVKYCIDNEMVFTGIDDLYHFILKLKLYENYTIKELKDALYQASSVDSYACMAFAKHPDNISREQFWRKRDQYLFHHRIHSLPGLHIKYYETVPSVKALSEFDYFHIQEDGAIFDVKSTFLDDEKEYRAFEKHADSVRLSHISNNELH